jgi:hypothetical protein
VIEIDEGSSVPFSLTDPKFAKANLGTFPLLQAGEDEKKGQNFFWPFERNL